MENTIKKADTQEILAVCKETNSLTRSITWAIHKYDPFPVWGTSSAEACRCIEAYFKSRRASETA